MTYTAWNKMVARLCIATSPNLLAWSRHGPAFAGTAYEDAWSKSGAIVARAAAGGRVIAERVQGRFWMYWGEHHVHLATSPDLIRWTPLLDAAAPLGEGYRGAPYNRPTPGLADAAPSAFSTRNTLRLCAVRARLHALKSGARVQRHWPWLFQPQPGLATFPRRRSEEEV